MSALIQFELMVTLLALALTVCAMLWLRWAGEQVWRWWRNRPWRRPGRRRAV